MRIEIISVAINESTDFYSNVRQIENFSTSVLKLELRFFAIFDLQTYWLKLKIGNWDFICCDKRINWLNQIIIRRHPDKNKTKPMSVPHYNFRLKYVNLDICFTQTSLSFQTWIWDRVGRWFWKLLLLNVVVTRYLNFHSNFRRQFEIEIYANLKLLTERFRR